MATGWRLLAVMDGLPEQSVSLFHRLSSLLEPYRKRVLLAFVLALAACALNLPVPVLIQGLVDNIAKGGSAPAYAAAALAAVFLLQALVGLGNTCTMGGVGLDVVRDLRHQLYARLQRAGLSFYDRTSAGAILSRLMDDVAAVQALISTQSLAILVDLGTAVLVAGLLAWHSLPLFAVAVVLLPCYVLFFRSIGHRMRAGADAVRAQLDGIFGHLKAKFDGVLVVKAHAREDAEIAAFAAQIAAAHEPRVKVERLGAALTSLSVAASGIGVTFIFAMGAYEALHGRLTPGEVVSAGVLAGLLFGPIARLADLTAIFQQAAASLGRLGEILDLRPDVAEPSNPVPLTAARGLVEFDRVHFHYLPGRPVLHDICLRIGPGMKVALVGPTGCGKTTLLNLLLRFYDPTQGEIRLDGIPLGRLALADLRRQIGVVPQESVLFRQTLADNIRYGVPDASPARVEAAARAALVHPFAAELPEGYDTVIGEGGFKLSHGQRQRVAIARALCKDPALVVLDEATSALDATSEAMIQAAMINLLRGRTAFVIAHRLGTVIDADAIIVIDRGRVVQMGRHAELFAQENELYRRLCMRQFGLSAEERPTGELTLRI
jgi:subfamily B ATP-binding cassette protein MsbA